MTWNLDSWLGIDAPGGWDCITDAPNVIVAVIDTGIYSDHPDLQKNMVRSFF